MCKPSLGGRCYNVKLYLAMKKKDEIKVVSDEIVVDSRDVERAEALSLKRGKNDRRVEHTELLDDGELLTSLPD